LQAHASVGMVDRLRSRQVIAPPCPPYVSPDLLASLVMNGILALFFGHFKNWRNTSITWLLENLSLIPFEK